MTTRRGRLVWGGILALAGAVELYGILAADPDDTLSEFTRWIFDVDSTTGAWVFGVGWVGFAAWYLVHIIGGRRRKKDDAEP